ncbi:argininosuccinate synthase [Candidatus Bathyarchaeota archaeon]|nr:argininosuccinate synthase [Candidatus Bathyarchaeota archaeon]
MADDSIKKIVLMYSGGLDTSCMLKWLQERYGAEIVSFTADLGQEMEDPTRFKDIEQKAYDLGVVKHFTEDLKEEFVRDYIFPTIKANGLYQGVYPLSTAVGRPLIAKYAVKIAEQENADAIAHGCTGKGNDQVRMNVTAQALNPKLKILMPMVEWGMGRDDEVKYAREHGISVSNVNKTYSTDENIFGRSCECGILEHPDEIAPEDACAWTVPPIKAPDDPEIIKIEFDKGVPVAIDGSVIDPIELIERVHRAGARHGVGRLDHMEDRTVGLKSRETYECPAAIILIKAHQDLEKFVCTKHENSFKSIVDQRWTELVYEGLWVDPLREALEAFINTVNQRVTGWVKVRLFKGTASVVARSSPYALYDLNLATYGKESQFDEQSAEGFIKLHGLQSRMGYRLKHGKKDK